MIDSDPEEIIEWINNPRHDLSGTAAPDRPPTSTTPGRFSAVLWQSHGSCLGMLSCMHSNKPVTLQRMWSVFVRALGWWLSF